MDSLTRFPSTRWPHSKRRLYPMSKPMLPTFSKPSRRTIKSNLKPTSVSSKSWETLPSLLLNPLGRVAQRRILGFVEQHVLNNEIPFKICVLGTLLVCVCSGPGVLYALMKHARCPIQKLSKTESVRQRDATYDINIFDKNNKSLPF